MMDKNENISPEHQKLVNRTIGFLSTSVALYALLRKGNYRVAFLLYEKSGGGGLNLYKEQASGKFKRCFAIDYHPFWDKKTKQSAWRLHYHRGENDSQMKKHRPYQGGW
ncbi:MULTISPECIES: hypothetical protein [Legionella]|uniref:Uncharacterized protein n=1 Tax=Legionella steelei TaxID=947033 RepID=A0A0W0ZD59_9GAMM|nr:MULTISPECIES: hypothetical protein [Legionella]KTD67000.1 hypothetical protein Lste_3206 [Legionella steelei]MBN9227265.1 hypothetical protein [Legionella steelei]OJW14029.1 MAG: hypothetical protein BGO44_08735 [Legionella sp. 39-23]